MFLNGMFSASIGDSKITTGVRNGKMVATATYDQEAIGKIVCNISDQINKGKDDFILKMLDDKSLDMLLKSCQKEKTHRELNDPLRNKS